MLNEIYFVVVVERVDSVQEYGDRINPKIWVACATENYSDAEMFQKMLLNALNHADIAVIVGADLVTGTGIVDIKVVLEDELN